MNVTKYLFTSPYPNQIQIGRLNPSSKKEDDSTNSSDSQLLKTTNETLNKAQFFQATQVKEVKPTVDSSPLLDTYA